MVKSNGMKINWYLVWSTVNIAVCMAGFWGSSNSDNNNKSSVWKVKRAARQVDLMESYVREVVLYTIENVSGQSQHEFFAAIDGRYANQVGHIVISQSSERKSMSESNAVVQPVGVREAASYNDEKCGSKGAFADCDTQLKESNTTIMVYRIGLNQPIEAGAISQIGISYHIYNALTALPRQIKQTDQQKLSYTFPIYIPSIYTIEEQATNVKFPSASSINDYSRIRERTGSGQWRDTVKKSGEGLTYGPYKNIEPRVFRLARVHYNFELPITVFERLQRVAQVNIWQESLTFTEEYWLVNAGANLSKPFSRMEWMHSHMRGKPVSLHAIQKIARPLPSDAHDVTYTDAIGNVSTSNLITREKTDNSPGGTYLTIVPRYPLFGGWRYQFMLSWKCSLSSWITSIMGKDGIKVYRLSVPFYEAIFANGGVQYGMIKVKVILPEDGEIIDFGSSLSPVHHHLQREKIYLDTIGRWAVEFTYHNGFLMATTPTVWVTYTLSGMAMLRKPLAAASVAFGGFMIIWVLSRVNLSIGDVRRG